MLHKHILITQLIELRVHALLEGLLLHLGLRRQHGSRLSLLSVQLCGSSCLRLRMKRRLVVLLRSQVAANRLRRQHGRAGPGRSGATSVAGALQARAVALAGCV